MSSLTLLRELAQRRALVLALTRRALLVRYRGTALGLLWSLVHPLALCAVYALVFGSFVGVGEVVRPGLGGTGYAAFLCAGLLPWLWFSQTISIAATSILGDAPFVRQAAFSPAIPAVVASLAGLVQFLIALPVLAGALLLLGVRPGPWLAALPLAVLLQWLLTLGLGLGLSALCVRFRDTAQVLQAVLPVWFLLTPVLYPAERLPEAVAWLRLVNPLAPLSESFQAALLSTGPPPAALAVSAGWAVLSLGVGAAVLERLRDRIPEEL